MIGLNRSSRSLPKAKLASKKGNGRCLVACCLSDPLQLSEPSETITSEKYAQQIDEMHPKLEHLQPALGNRKGPVLFHDNTQPRVTQLMLQKLNELGYEVLFHLPHSPNLLPTDYHIFKHLDSFLQGKCFHNQQEAENGFKSLLNFEPQIIKLQ